MEQVDPKAVYEYTIESLDKLENLAIDIRDEYLKGLMLLNIQFMKSWLNENARPH